MLHERRILLEFRATAGRRQAPGGRTSDRAKLGQHEGAAVRPSNGVRRTSALIGLGIPLEADSCCSATGTTATRGSPSPRGRGRRPGRRGRRDLERARGRRVDDHFFVVADQAWQALLGLPAWLAVGCSPARWRRAACARRGSAALSRASSPRCATPPPKRSSGSIPRGRSSAGTRARRRSTGTSGRGGRRAGLAAGARAEAEESMRPAAAASSASASTFPARCTATNGGARGLADGRPHPERRRRADRRRGRDPRHRSAAAETRQRESEAKYRALTEHLPTITYVHPLGERTPRCT